MFVLHFFWITLNIKVTQAWQLTHGIALLWQQRQENTHQFQASCENLSQSQAKANKQGIEKKIKQNLDLVLLL